MNTLLLLALLASPSPNNRYNANIVGTANDRDSAQAPLSIVGKAPLNTYANSNTQGGDINLTPGSGLVKITGVTRAATTGDTVTTIFRKIGSSAATTVILTEGDGTGGTFDCDGAASDEACVSNFITTLNANTNIAGYLLGVYVAASETASIGVVDGMTASITSVTASDPTNFVVTRGADGSAIVYGGFRNNDVKTYTTSSTLTTAECGALVLSATNAVVLTLPNIAAANQGCCYKFGMTGARTAVLVSISPDASDNIAGSCGAVVIDGAVNTDLQNTALTHEVWDSATICSDGVSTWGITSCTGIWTHE